MQTELKFLGYTLGLYVCFIYWGYLQEKLTSTKYKVPSTEFSDNTSLEWNYPFALNCIMAISASTAASIVEMFFESGGGHKKSKIPFTKYYKAALSSALASPIGYAALKFISFPLLVLTKSSKPVPVMFVGVLFYGRRYTWYKVVSVLLLCGGIAMFSSAKKGHDSSADSKSATPEAYSDSVKLMIGIFLVSMNLLLDAFTSNEQDQIFDEGANSYQVMKNVNLWQAFYLFAYLVVTWLIMGDTSELSRANHVFTQSAEVRQDILWFCICASMGQILIFAVMKEFGSLVWITISITRKLITILFSVFMFNHTVKLIQWLGIAAVFAGMTLEVVMSYASKGKPAVEKAPASASAASAASSHSSDGVTTISTSGSTEKEEEEEEKDEGKLRKRKSTAAGTGTHAGKNNHHVVKTASPAVGGNKSAGEIRKKK